MTIVRNEHAFQLHGYFSKALIIRNYKKKLCLAISRLTLEGNLRKEFSSNFGDVLITILCNPSRCIKIDFTREGEFFPLVLVVRRKSGGQKNLGAAWGINRKAGDADSGQRVRGRRINYEKVDAINKCEEVTRWEETRRRGVSPYRGKRMLGPIPAAHARKRVETLYDRHATLTKSASLLSRRETEGKINGDRSPLRDTIGTPDRIQPWRRDTDCSLINLFLFTIPSVISKEACVLLR